MPDSAAIGDAALAALAGAVAERLLACGHRMATAESCTGGLVAKLLTDIPGSSAWFERGLVTYSNASKQSLLGVPATVLERVGAVSAETALAMAQGLQESCGVEWTLAVTGIAGPGGAVEGKPVGTVWIAWTGSGRSASASRYLFPGDRDQVRRATAGEALRGLLEMLTG